ncbi:MAG: protein kinase [Monoraphidium minutum]|nr:MAG: protein kinase [Monoraphidium minutum]
MPARDPEQQKSPGASLHGDSAARRQAITELLFFSAVGDLVRCKKICAVWQINPHDQACCDYDKRTPLHLSAAEGCYSVVQWLLDECSVEVNPVDRFKRTPLEDAVRGDHGEVVTMLISRGGKVMGQEGQLIDLSDSRLSGNVRIFGELDPEWEINAKQLQFGDKVGEGEFGIVYRATYLGTPVAVKVLKDNNAVAIGDFRTELNVLQKLHHPHCVQFFGAVTKTSPYMILTEFMGCGSLADLFKARVELSTRRAVQLALDCARGIAYLHNHQPLTIIHRDLKPANLMIGGGPDTAASDPALRSTLLHELGIVKIADFGLSKSLKLKLGGADGGTAAAAAAAALGGGAMPAVSEVPPGGPPGGVRAGSIEASGPSFKLTGETGSYRYMAPEVFRHELYNHKVDVYSFAMIAYQLFEGVPPFAKSDPVEAARQASLEGVRPQWGESNGSRGELPAKLKHLVEQCWAADYETRPEFTQIIATLQEVLQGLPADVPQASGCACSVQ